MDIVALDDLKDFILATNNQLESRLTAYFALRLGSEISGLRSELRYEMLEGFAGIANAIDCINDRLDLYQDATDKRLFKLESTVWPKTV